MSVSALLLAIYHRDDAARDALLEAYEVSSAVNRTANDSAMLIEPLREPEMAEAVATPAPKRVKKEKEKKDDGQASLF